MSASTAYDVSLCDEASAACPICAAAVPQVGLSKYGKISVPVLHCRACDVYIRALDSGLREQQLLSASYVRLENEPRFWEQRHDFFEHILQLAADRIDGGSRRLLDVGCSYGHLLEIARNRGFAVEGIESNEELVRLCNSKGLKVVGQASNVSAPADVITFIDSLYCFSQPIEILEQARDLLTARGLVIIRVTNRNWLARLRAKTLHNCEYTLLGDTAVSYSVRGITRLLEVSGLSVMSILVDGGVGKHVGWKSRIMYRTTRLATALTLDSTFLTPGIIVLARRT